MGSSTLLGERLENYSVSTETFRKRPKLFQCSIELETMFAYGKDQAGILLGPFFGGFLTLFWTLFQSSDCTLLEKLQFYSG